MPSTKGGGIWRWITDYVSPVAAVLAVLDAVVATTTTGTAVERFHTTINPFWIYTVAYFSVAIPLSFALAPLAGRLYRVIDEWWTRDERLFESIKDILEELRETDFHLARIGIGDEGDMTQLNQLGDDLRSRLTALGIRTDIDTSELLTEVLHGTLRRARKL